MYNDWLTIGPVTVHGYGAMIAIGIITAYLLACRLAKQRGLNEDKIFDLVIACVITGFAGSKILYLITVLPSLLQNPGAVLIAFRDGWVVYGGLIGGIIGAFAFAKKWKLPIMRYLDVLITAVPLGQAFGRIGCFFAGCCYGRPTDSAFAITFHHSYFAPNDIPLIPTQLICSVLDLLMVFALLTFHKKMQKKDGEALSVFLILYSIGRFLLEFLRGDLERGAVGALSTSQFIAIFTLVAGVVMFVSLRKLQTKADLPETTEEPIIIEEAGTETEE